MSSESLLLAQSLAYKAIQKPSATVGLPTVATQVHPPSGAEPKEQKKKFPIFPILAGAVAVMLGGFFLWRNREKYIESAKSRTKPLVEDFKKTSEDTFQEEAKKTKPKAVGSPQATNQTKPPAPAPPAAAPAPPPPPPPPATPSPSLREPGVKRRRLSAFALTVFTGLTGLGAIADRLANKGMASECVADFTTHLINPNASSQKAATIVPQVSGKLTEILGKTEHLLPKLKYTNETMPYVDSSRPISNRVVDKKGTVIDKPFYKAVGISDKYFDSDGNSYIFKWDSGNNHFVIENIQRMSASDKVHLFTLKPNQYIITQPFADYETSKRYIEKQGLELVGIVGTGTITTLKEPGIVPPEQVKKGFHGIGYNYFNAERLTGRATAAIENGNWFRKRPNISITGGHYTLKNGESHALDFWGENMGDVQKKIMALKKRPDVVSISLVDWPLKETQSLRRGDFTPQARFGKAFNKKGKLLGLFITPPIGMLDTVTVAKSLFSEELGSVVMGDGDFYAKYARFYDQDELSDPMVKRLIAANWVVQPRQSLPEEVKAIGLKSLSDCAYEGDRWHDRIGDANQRLRSWDLLELWKKIQNHT